MNHDEGQANLSQDSDNLDSTSGDADGKTAHSDNSALSFGAFYSVSTTPSTRAQAQDAPTLITGHLKQASSKQIPDRQHDHSSGAVEEAKVKDINDDLAELEAWLLSGEIDIVSEL
jgi:hypothetical protein